MVTHDHTRRTKATSLTARRGRLLFTLLPTEACAGIDWSISLSGADPTAHLRSAHFARSMTSVAHTDPRSTYSRSGGGKYSDHEKRGGQRRLLSKGIRNLCETKGYFRLWWRHGNVYVKLLLDACRWHPPRTSYSIGTAYISHTPYRNHSIRPPRKCQLSVVLKESLVNVNAVHEHMSLLSSSRCTSRPRTAE